MKEILIKLASEMKIKNLSFSGALGCFIYGSTLINFLINSDLKTTMWIDSRKDKIKDNVILFTLRQNLQIEIFDFSELNILEAAKELCQMGKI